MTGAQGSFVQVLLTRLKRMVSKDVTRPVGRSYCLEEDMI